MKIYEMDGQKYQLPGNLTDFQRQMYIHLINWKWNHLTTEPGHYRGSPYDALLPDSINTQQDPLYPPIKERFFSHQKKFPFKSHLFFGHMASSQAACVNLFLPLFENPRIAATILGAVKEDLKEIATDYLDNGFRIEFWDEPDNILNDHTRASGTDADIAIAYFDHLGDLNLWLIEHKLTETEFTDCGGYKSKGRTCYHVCRPASAILENFQLCYYHNVCDFHYWDLTIKDRSPFDISLIRNYPVCPFKNGMNQLWRNQLLAFGLESSKSPKWPFRKVYFSVVTHPRNKSLIPTIREFETLVSYSDRFFSFTSDRLLKTAQNIKDPNISKWIRWYQELYYF